MKAQFQVQDVQGFSVVNSSLLQVEMQTRQNPQTPPWNDDAVCQRIDWLLKLSQNWIYGIHFGQGPERYDCQ